jgi:membrane associated rhomboid family serine protease
MITRLLIILNVVGFLWEIHIAGPGMVSPTGGGNIERVLQLGSLYPAAALQEGQWWRILTAGFLHAGLIHIFVNMISLWALGRFMELVLGPTRMLVIYVLSLIASGLGVIYLSSPQNALVGTLGASGAIFGLFGALFAVGFKLGRPGRQLIRDNVGILVLNLIITFTVPSISWQAHLSGLVAGFILTYALYFPPRRVAPVVVDASTGNALETEYQAPNEPPHAPPLS